MSNQFHYPFKVLKKKFNSPTHTPFVMDCNTGGHLAAESKGNSKYMDTLLKGMFAVLSLAFLYFVVAEPVVQTAQANDNVSKALVSISNGDIAVINKLKSENVIQSETSVDNLTTLVFAVDNSEVREVLKLAFKLSTIREVYTDGKTIAITFMSSAQ